jgi:hypothetical protein
VGDGVRQQGIPGKRVGFVQFTGVHIRFARVTSGVDDERRLSGFKKIQQCAKAGVINLLSRQRNKICFAPHQFTRERFADVAGGAKK